MSIYLNIKAIDPSSRNTLLDIQSTMREAAELFDRAGIDVSRYPDSTGSIFKDCPSHIVMNFLIDTNMPIDCPAIQALICICQLQHCLVTLNWG